LRLAMPAADPGGPRPGLPVRLARRPWPGLPALLGHRACGMVQAGRPAAVLPGAPD